MWTILCWSAGFLFYAFFVIVATDFCSKHMLCLTAQWWPKKRSGTFWAPRPPLWLWFGVESFPGLCEHQGGSLLLGGLSLGPRVTPCCGLLMPARLGSPASGWKAGAVSPWALWRGGLMQNPSPAVLFKVGAGERGSGAQGLARWSPEILFLNLHLTGRQSRKR